jgi:hypothetical protein
MLKRSITSFLAAFCIHTIDLRRSTGIHRQLAEHRARICLMGLKEIQKYWKINDTVLDLFSRYLDKATTKRLQTNEFDLSTGEGFDTTHSFNNSSNLGRTPVTADVPQHDMSELASLDHFIDNWVYDYNMLTDIDMYTNVGDDMQGFEILQRRL